MNKVLKTTMVSLLFIGMAFTIGCSKKEKLPPGDIQDSIGSSGATYLVSCIGDINSQGGWISDPPSKKGPPSGWTPDADGWYKQTYSSDYEAYLRWRGPSPNDPWADPPNTGTPKGLEYKMSYALDTTSISMYYNWYLRCDYANFTDTTKVEGEWYWDFRYEYEYGGESFDLSFFWKMTYDNVATASDDCEGHYVLECIWPYVPEGESEIKYVDLTGEFTINSDGSGTGEIACDDKLAVKYTFTSCTPCHGYYTLAAENWGTEHSF